MPLIPLHFEKMLHSNVYTCLVLRAREVCFPIFCESSVGEMIQQFLLNTPAKRPPTHHLILSLFQGFQLSFHHIVIHNVEDNIFYVRIVCEQEIESGHYFVEIDARPSDAIIFALHAEIPMYCTEQLLQQVIPFEE